VIKSVGWPAGEDQSGDVSSGFPYYSPVRIRADLAKYDAAPRKRWGQCFLVEPGLIRNIAARVLEQPTDLIFEIGPGLGALTYEFLRAGRTVAAVEIDPAMSQLLRDLTESDAVRAAGGRLWLRTGDARDMLSDLRQGPVEFEADRPPVDPRNLPVVCGNLPYYITTELLTACMDLPALRRGFFLTQFEFAQRIVASDARSSLNVYLRNFGAWRATLQLKASAFYPRPTVASALVEFHAREDGPCCDAQTLQQLLRMSFGARRKKLVNSWKQDRRGLISIERLMAAASAAGVDSERRAEELPIEAYYQLANLLHRDGVPVGNR
jgi:16S rRNA (adenine1518-N6/adenine1519-N6)-dimethyltransferase